jgi:hypothetical protein
VAHREDLAAIQDRVVDVLCRQGLWHQGVRLAMSFNQEQTELWVLIDPGGSGLSARQVLDRLLGH